MVEWWDAGWIFFTGAERGVEHKVELRERERRGSV